MGTAREPAPVKYFVAALSSDRDLLEQIEPELALLLGVVDLRSATFPWEFSAYYEKEMGPGLLRRFISLTSLAPPDQLAEFKTATQKIEERHRLPERGRRVNLDPGYLDAYKVALASTKNAGQRIYLRQGIYAEATLLFRDAAFHGLEYTYRDYLGPEALGFFAALRSRYLEQLRQR